LLSVDLHGSKQVDDGYASVMLTTMLLLHTGYYSVGKSGGDNHGASECDVDYDCDATHDVDYDGACDADCDRVSNSILNAMMINNVLLVMPVLLL
jgi:hypothetical protein